MLCVHERVTMKLVSSCMWRCYCVTTDAGTASNADSVTKQPRCYGNPTISWHFLDRLLYITIREDLTFPWQITLHNYKRLRLCSLRSLFGSLQTLRSRLSGWRGVTAFVNSLSKGTHLIWQMPSAWYIIYTGQAIKRFCYIRGLYDYYPPQLHRPFSRPFNHHRLSQSCFC